ncbi:alpha-ketoglutarate-dependent dioxygenase AlkB [Tomitella fengzijianii]|uniref:Alpha-ketoglutarate-dependent dioxygenase AlkB n=1 Tax=Tomitella fengzijianii TaxID=2597660 RepID=A0A516X1P0_9ACTN|nr:alpha-ketoglutarate-dependent dioxygenase AlkB [Tomitella fengzijianii]QDQ97004.1 alpha-ketoglutarate-dependent dioxygenase AlkB [Tomitella fengzijianii]
MTAAFQPTLFDSAVDRPCFRALPAATRAHGGPADPGAGARTPLADGAWVELHPNWLRGADELPDRLTRTVDWRAERRTMYDRVVNVPRLVRFYGEDEPLPHPLIAQGLSLLSARFGAELGEPFRTVGMCRYRDGSDSVAWHGDDIGRGRTEDTMVAILSLGAARTLLLRPRRRPEGAARSASLRFPLGHGDLIVMGGSCQRTWEHCIPKSTRVSGPRISVQFRPRGVR